MKIIPVKLCGVKASVPMLVDDADYERISKTSWQLTREGRANGTMNKKNVLAHRVILKAEKGQMIDHRDGNPLNNQKSNLRFCTASENMSNRSKYRTNRSGFKGVSWCRTHKKWIAIICKKKKRFNLGYFSTAELAHKAYKKAAVKLHGEFAKW